MYELGQLCVLHGEISDDEPVQSASFPVEHLLVLPLKPPSQVTVHGVQFVHGLHSTNKKHNEFFIFCATNILVMRLL